MARRCEFCGEREAVYADGMYVCDDPDCDEQAREVARERYEHDMQDAIDRVNFEHGYF